jgi:uncharacterized protein YxjI
MLDRRTYLVKERVAMLRLIDTYDILDPGTGATIGIAQERISGGMKALRLIINKRLLPTTVVISEREGGPAILTIKRGVSFLHAAVHVLDARGSTIGSFKSKLFSLGGAFRVFNSAGAEVALVKGDWKGWNFQFLENGGRRLGTVTKKWAGIGKELFTSADNYVISLEAEGMPPVVASLLLAAGIAIDTVYKEK